ncbi:MAG: hypothetical protein AUG46_04325 [Acidobacteria bacterium 13_1_20CM_3_58_11]|nr:MAG: hypothetical protein AUG46_04325 [Acidobacteria bacterium 13_1_20CM_3_58_11]
MMSNGKRFLLVLGAVVVLVGVPPLAQERKGGIRGHVTDNSGGILQGARIELQPKGIIVVSNTQGEFFIKDVDPGSFTISITYVGFNGFTKQVTVSAGQIASLDAKLEVGSQNLEVLVTAGRASGEAEEINRQLTADNLVQVLTSDVIRSLPNANMADALGRLPSVTLERDEGEGKYVQVRGTEPRLTSVTINGINVPSPESGVRQIKLDSIPADIVESVEINKTLQANMDADGIGGSVNLVTKTAGERPTITLNGMSGYTPIVNGRGLVETAATMGQRFGSDKRFGALIGGTYDWNGRGIDDIEPVPDIATLLPGSPRWFDTIDQREYRYYRSRWGLAGSTDYRLAEGSNIYLRGFYSDFKNFGDRWVYTLNDNTDPVAAGLLNGNGGAPSFNTQIRLPDYGIGSLVLGGKHVRTSSWFAWDVSASRSRQLGENDPTASFRSNLASSSCTFDPAATKNIYLPQWAPVCYSEAHDPTTMSLDRIGGAAIGLTAQLNLQVTGAVAKNYHLGSHLSTIEVGGKFRNEHKFDNSFTPDFSVPAGMTLLPLNTFPNVFSNSDYYNGAYPLGYNPGYRAVLAAFNTAMPGALSGPPVVSGNNFDLIEKVSAGYLMNTIDSNRVRLVAGVRFEGTNLDALSFDSVAGTLTSKLGGSYLKVLPSVSARVALTGDTDLRLVYGRGLSRPNPQDIAQAASFSTGGGINTASLGNPNLKAETADNFDVLLEHSLKPFGLISAGFFYKNLGDPIVTKTLQIANYQPPVSGAPPGLYNVTQPVNAGSAWVTGFEVAYLQHLTFLPGLLSGFGISANYGYTDSRATGLSNRADNPRLSRSAPHTWNISPTYDRGRFSFRAGLSYNAANIFEYRYQDGSDPLAGGPATISPGGIKGPDSDIYLDAHLQVDVQGSYRLVHGLQFVMYGLNLNNEVFGFYQGSPQYMIQREYYKPTVAAGFRWSPFHEK